MKSLLLLAVLALPAAAEPLDRTKAPPLSEARPVLIPETVVVPGPLRLDVTTDRERPYVTLIIALAAAGEAAQPPGMAGLAELTAGLLDEGAVVRENGIEKRLDSTEFGRELKDLAISFSAKTLPDATIVQITTLKDTLPRALQLAAAAIRRPTFEQPNFERVRRQIEVSLLEKEATPSDAASKRSRQLVYGDHPYGAVATPATVSRLTLDDVRAFHASSFGPTSISAVGDIDADELKKLAEENFLKGPGLGVGDAVAAARRVGALPHPDVRAAAREGQLDLIDLPGSEQSFIIVTQAGLERAHPDFPALGVLNMILGGVHESRLEMIIREKNGWAYMARSGVAASRNGGRIVLQSPVRADHTAEAVQVMLDQLERLTTEIVPEAELAVAKKRLVSSLEDASAENEDIATERAGEAILGLPPDANIRLRAAVSAVTAGDVLRAAQTYLRPDRTAVVIAGDKKAILDSLKENPLRLPRQLNVLSPLEKRG